MPKIKISQETPTPEVLVASNKEFDELIAKIKDRSPELADTFSASIKFISYEENILTWESCAGDAAKKSLTHGYAAIKQLVREVYGFNTKIKSMACSRDISMRSQAEHGKEMHAANIQQPTMPEPQNTSMIEEAEIGGSGSCVTGCSPTGEPMPEIDGADILNDPIVQRATELFEATKRTVQLKI
ncbi:MAG: hypothetical protein Q9M43_01780 [Sulfurimonas sp.]|nr:hypothetical protein [Sulfurimonas sp.]